MRWIVIALLMGNAIYWFWHQATPEYQAEQVAVPPVATNVAPLKLLTEVDPVNRAAAVVNEPSRAMCWVMGPFKEQISIKQVTTRLAALDIELQFQDQVIEGEPDYWVHIPPQPSRKSAIKLLRQLQASKIDSFLITEGELANGLSLGLFTQQYRAKKVHKQRVAQGYDAHIKVVPRTTVESWAVFDGAKYGEMTEELWNKIKEGHKGLERRKNFCDTIASTHNID